MACHALTSSTTAAAPTSKAWPTITATANRIDSHSFKAYNASEIEGSTLPNLAAPHADGGCGILGQIFMIVVAIAVTVATAGALGSLAGAGISSMETGVSVLTGASELGGGAAFATATVAGATGSIASQVAGNAVGAHHGFSWKEVAMSGLAAGFAAGLGPVNSALSGFDKVAAYSGRAMVSNTLTQGVAVATGLQSSFNWRNVAAAGIGAGVGVQVGGLLGNSFNGLGQFGSQLAHSSVSSFAAGVTASLVSGDRLNLTQIALNTFGNALGSSLASGNLSRSSGSASRDRGNVFADMGSEIGTYNGMTAQGALDSLGSLNVANDGYIGSSTYGLGELRAAGLNVPQASRFLMPLGDGGDAPRMGDTGPVNEEIDPSIPAVTITGHRLSFFQKIGSYFGDAVDAIKGIFSTQDYSQQSDYQMAQLPFSDFAANMEKANRAAARGQLPYTMGGVVTDVVKYGIKGGAAMAAFPYAVSAVSRMGASQAYSILGGSMLTDAGLQAINNLDGSQRGWDSTQSAISVGLPLVAVGAKPAAMWLASGLENGVNIGGVKILDPRTTRMYAVPPGGANSTSAVAIAGETKATSTGKAVHTRIAAERRSSGDFDLVNQPITDANGIPIQVTKRVNLKTGDPMPESGYQISRPDGVKNDIIIDDKPLGRPISKDQQEIIRFINAYKESNGTLPRTIGIQRYDPVTGMPVHTELYTPSDFMPWSY